MEENLDINYKVNNEKSDNTNKLNSEEIKEPTSERDPNTVINNDNSQSKLVSKVNIKNEIDTTVKPVAKPKKELPIEKKPFQEFINIHLICLLYTSPSPRDRTRSRMPSSA